MKNNKDMKTITAEEQAWMDERHDPAWVPGKSGGRIVRRESNGRFAR